MKCSQYIKCFMRKAVNCFLDNEQIFIANSNDLKLRILLLSAITNNSFTGLDNTSNTVNVVLIRNRICLFFLFVWWGPCSLSLQFLCFICQCYMSDDGFVNCNRHYFLSSAIFPLDSKLLCLNPLWYYVTLMVLIVYIV